MPIIKSAKKAARQTTKRTAKNQEIKKAIKAALKTFKADPTAENMKKIQSEYDKAVKKGLLKKNTASRRKSRLTKIAKELQAGEKKVKKVVKKTAKKVAKAAK
ncbi:30S ribosomal protein S20 [Candidatus Saccharibacteria bacterium]|nr:30S ribosomal protein S20 [Candidatus Saccharibacteria bacterium]